ncbi:centromere protein U isoform X2 [Ascaphus truei]|uniref:centromere protein U isoform X2 n=1 Tax=Ascaphus truei TaxID=8439 RepID=UPI003F5927DF
MSTKKNPPKNKNDGKKGLEVEVVDQLKIPEVRYAAEIMVPQSKGNKETSSYPKEMLLVHPDISSILKESEDLEQDEEHDEYFDHPLHSTAVDADWNEVLEKAELQKKKSTKDVPQIPSVSKGTHKSKSQSSVTSKRKTRKSVTDHATQKDTTRKRTQTPHRAESQVREFPPCSNIKDYPEKMALEDLPGQDSDNHSSQGVAHTLQEPAKSNKSGRKRRKSGGSPKKKADKSRGRKRNNSIPKESATSGRNKPASLKIWCPEGLPRSARDQNELDVVLFEFEDIVTDYKQTVDSDVCKKLTDRFFSSFKEQLTESLQGIHARLSRWCHLWCVRWYSRMYWSFRNQIEDIQKLRNLKRKNAKIHLEIGKKRKRLIEVNNELIATEPKLKQLRREYSELQEKQSALTKAKEFLINLKELQGNYLKFKAENPESEETYGVSSLPALLLQSQTVLEAEKHFQNINRKLQCFIDKRKEEI